MGLIQAISSNIQTAQDMIQSLSPFATPSPGVFERIRKAWVSQPEPSKRSWSIEDVKKHASTLVIILATGTVSFYVFRFIRQSMESLDSPTEAPLERKSPKQEEKDSEEPNEPITPVPSSSQQSETTTKTPSPETSTSYQTQISETPTSHSPELIIEEVTSESLYHSSLDELICPTLLEISLEKVPDLTIEYSAKLFAEIGQKTINPDCFTKPYGISTRYYEFQCPKETVLPLINNKEQYLHANLIGKGVSDRQFIIAQAPQDIGFFWDAIYKYGSSILDLVQRREILGTTQIINGKEIRIYPVGRFYPLVDEQKPQQPLPKTQKQKHPSPEPELQYRLPYYYLPKDEKQLIDYGQWDVTITSQEPFKPLEESLLSNYEMKSAKENPIQPPKTVKILHFRNWLEDAISVNDLSVLVNFLDTEGFITQDRYPFVICRPGNSKSAVVITASVVKEKIQQGEINKSNFDEKLIEIILELRKQAGEKFVNTAGKFHLIRLYGYHLLELDKHKIN